MEVMDTSMVPSGRDCCPALGLLSFSHISHCLLLDSADDSEAFQSLAVLDMDLVSKHKIILKGLVGTP